MRALLAKRGFALQAGFCSARIAYLEMNRADLLHLTGASKGVVMRNAFAGCFVYFLWSNEFGGKR